MPKYQYSIIRFVPSPVRGEFVNLGLLLGSDQTGEWWIDVVGSRSRATKLDDDGVLPFVATDIQRLQSLVESYSDPDLLSPEITISEQWLSELSRDSQNQLQFSKPNSVIGETIEEAFEKLWGLLVVEPIPTKRQSMTKATVTARYVTALERLQLHSGNLKRRARLETSRTHTNIDVAVHNGVVKDITQCWSLQIKAAEPLLNEIKAWGWTIKTLRDQGGKIFSDNKEITVPHDVRVGVIYAPTDDTDLKDEAFEVFTDSKIAADCVSVDDVGMHAEAAAKLVSNQTHMDWKEDKPE